jgi:hypothetical protein
MIARAQDARQVVFPCTPALCCSAPRPSLLLIAPVLAFVLASIFIAVYWPRDTQPDGGVAVLVGAGGAGASME